MHRGPASISFDSIQLGLSCVCPSCLMLLPNSTRFAVLSDWSRDPNGEWMYYHRHDLAVAAARALRVDMTYTCPQRRRYSSWQGSILTASRYSIPPSLTDISGRARRTSTKWRRVAFRPEEDVAMKVWNFATAPEMCQ